MNSWTGTRGRQLVALMLITAVLVLGSVFVAYADSTSRQPSAVMLAQGDETPMATLSASTQGAEAAVVGSTEVPTPTLTPTFTPPPQPVCTPPPCQPGEVYYCPGECPGGCGTQCVRPTEQHPGGPTGVRNVIMNGGFELGFVEGVGVANGWERFQNGNVHAGWYDDSWDKVVYEGEHAQLMELKDAHEHDRYVGIFQKVHVAPNAEYNLTMYGLVRSDSGSAEASDYGFQMQYGIDYMGGTDWQSPNIEWVTLPWEEQLRTDPTRIDSYTTMIKTHGPGLTLFIRGLKKWPDAVEGNYDVDAVSLVGPLPPSGKWPPGMQPPPGQQPPDMQPPPGQQPPGMQPPPGQHPSPTPGPMMPETGNVFDVLENPVLVVLSIALLVVLVGGAAWGVRQRRT
jgi:hypothetical protein